MKKGNYRDNKKLKTIIATIHISLKKQVFTLSLLYDYLFTLSQINTFVIRCTEQNLQYMYFIPRSGEAQAGWRGGGRG